jgi:hypothetical protein
MDVVRAIHGYPTGYPSTAITGRIAREIHQAVVHRYTSFSDQLGSHGTLSKV